MNLRSPVVVLGLALAGYAGWGAMSPALPRPLRAPGLPFPGLGSTCCGGNRTAALATLRNLAACQERTRTGGDIDVDGDGIGEYGTFLELTSSTGLRRDAEGAIRGAPLATPILSPALAGVDPSGLVFKSGYVFRIFLPGRGGTGVREIGPGTAARGGGGGRTCCCGPPRAPTPPPAPAAAESNLLTGPADVDTAEARWCAYAWPVAVGNSGTEVFFVDQDGEVWRCANAVLPYSGAAGRLPAWDAAMPLASGPGWASLPAKAQTVRGRDGNVWTRTN